MAGLIMGRTNGCAEGLAGKAVARAGALDRLRNGLMSIFS